MFKYQKTGEMDSEYPFLFCPKSDFWMEIPDDKVNSFENTKRQTPKMTFVFVLRKACNTGFSLLLLKNFQKNNFFWKKVLTVRRGHDILI